MVQLTPTLQIHSSPRVSYYFAKGVGEYHFGVRLTSFFTVCIITDTASQTAQERHPMKPHRLTLTNHLVIGYGLHRLMDMYQPRPATKDELEMFHDQDYVDFLARWVGCRVGLYRRVQGTELILPPPARLPARSQSHSRQCSPLYVGLVAVQHWRRLSDL